MALFDGKKRHLVPWILSFLHIQWCFIWWFYVWCFLLYIFTIIQSTWARCGWKITWILQLLSVNRCFRHPSKTLNTKIIYDIFFHAGIPILHYLYFLLIRVWHLAIQLRNENIDVSFENSEIKVDSSVYRPNKKLRFSLL